eukprot:6191348-Lingulodinium_polyedra.AAC.1
MQGQAYSGSARKDVGNGRRPTWAEIVKGFGSLCKEQPGEAEKWCKALQEEAKPKRAPPEV